MSSTPVSTIFGYNRIFHRTNNSYVLRYLTAHVEGSFGNKTKRAWWYFPIAYSTKRKHRTCPTVFPLNIYSQVTCDIYRVTLDRTSIKTLCLKFIISPIVMYVYITRYN